MSITAVVRTYIAQIRPRAQAELNWFQKQPTLESAIERAALAVNSKGKRYSHQRRLKKAALEQARRALLANTRAIEQSKSFDGLFTLIDAILKPIYGVGEVYVYDTALRIGAKLNNLPTRVYLHAGTRVGARALGFEGKIVALEVADLPSEFLTLKPHEIEDVLCIFKADLKSANIKLAAGGLANSSWCG